MDVEGLGVVVEEHPVLVVELGHPSGGWMREEKTAPGSGLPIELHRVS